MMEAALNRQAPAAKTPETRPRLCLMADLLDEWEVEAKAAHLARVQKVARGPLTGFPKLDDALGGCLPVGLNIMHGQPGVGKSAFALQIAAQCQFPALYVTCEMSPLELLRRQTARVTGQHLHRFKSGEFSPADSLAYARRGAAAAPYLALIDATRASAGLSYLQECVETVRARAQRDGQDARQVLVVVDSLHSWTESVAMGGGSESSEYELLNAGLAGLRTLSHSACCPILAIAERNRDSMKSGGLSAGAGTRKLEYGAETVFDLSRDEMARESSGPTEVVVKLAKNRNGAAGKTAPMLFHGAKQFFEER